MDERDQQDDSLAVERAFDRLNARIARLETSYPAHYRGDHKEADSSYLTASNVLHIVVTVLLAVLGYMVTQFQSDTKGKIDFMTSEIYAGRERDLTAAKDLGQTRGVLESLIKDIVSLKDELRVIRESRIADRARDGKRYPD